MDAEVLTPKEYARLRKMKIIDDEQMFDMQRYEIERFWCMSVHDNEHDIIGYELSGLKSYVTSRMMWMREREDVEYHDRVDLVKRHKMDFSNNMLRGDLLDQGLYALGIVDSDGGLVSNLSDLEFYKDGQAVNQFIVFAEMEGVSAYVKSAFNMKLKCKKLYDSPLSVIKIFCKKAGFVIGDSKQVKSGGKSIRVSKLNMNRNEVIDEIIRIKEHKTRF